MKKFFRYFRYAAFLLLVVMLFPTTQFAFARSSQNSSLRVQRGEYRSDIVTYIHNNWENFFSKDELESYGDSNILIAEPYGVYSLDEGKMIATKFPIYVDGKCVQVLDVFEDENGRLTWSATISEDFLQQIDDLRHKEGKYRFETKDDPNGGAPSLNIVRLPNYSFKSIDNTQYSNINDLILVIDTSKRRVKPDLKSTMSSNILKTKKMERISIGKDLFETLHGSYVVKLEL